MQTKSNQILNVLERDGWCKYSSINDMGERCLVGAAREVLGAVGSVSPILDAMRCVIRRENIMDWNDDTGRTFNDVRKALLAAASLELSNHE